MNIDKIEFNEARFIYPVAEGCYSAREFSFIENGGESYAVSSYLLDNEEGIMLVDGDITRIPASSGSAFHPVSVIYKGMKYLFWSEFADRWVLKSNLTDSIPDLKGHIFVHSAVTDGNGNLYLACENLNGYMKSDICVLGFDGNSWKIYKKINKSRLFCKRPVLAAFGDTVSVIWDGYEDGYDIYVNSFESSSWSGEIRISDSDDWDLKPSAAYDKKGSLWISWIRNTDVERSGVVSKTNHVYMACVKNKIVIPVHGNDSPEVLQLNLGLLPAKRYFGYHGLRRNPQTACFENGNIGLFWESQRDETENWDNVENGWFLCKIFNGIWSPTHIIQNGGNCFTIDSSSLIDETLNYSYRGNRSKETDIRISSVKVSEIPKFNVPVYSEWINWKPMKPKAKPSKEGIYWGDLHCHSIYSPDAEGYPDELFLYARDKACIDLCAITDNDIYGNNILTRSHLRYIATLCDYISKNGVFQAYTGYEWTFHKSGLDEPDNFNHRTVVFLDDNIRIASRADETGNTESAFCSTLENTKTVWHAHHGMWNILDPLHDRNVEIISAWMNNIEKFVTVNEALDKGQVFGFMGASDNHRFIPGNGGALTAIICSDLIKDKINSAIYTRHNYATSGSRTLVDLSIGKAFIGDYIEVGQDCNIQVDIKVVSGREIDYVELIQAKNAAKRVYIGKTSFYGKFNINISQKRSWLYLKIKLSGPDPEFEHNLSLAKGNYVYAGPIWIHD